MAKIQLEPILNMIGTLQAFMDVYDCCEYEETQEELFREIKTKINQLDRLVRLIKTNYEKELMREKQSPEERKFEDFLERNQNNE